MKRKTKGCPWKPFQEHPFVSRFTPRLPIRRELAQVFGFEPEPHRLFEGAVDGVHDGVKGFGIEQTHGQTGFDASRQENAVGFYLGTRKAVLVVRPGFVDDQDPPFLAEGQEAVKDRIVYFFEKSFTSCLSNF